METTRLMDEAERAGNVAMRQYLADQLANRLQYLSTQQLVQMLDDTEQAYIIGQADRQKQLHRELGIA